MGLERGHPAARVESGSVRTRRRVNTTYVNAASKGAATLGERTGALLEEIQSVERYLAWLASSVSVIEQAEEQDE